MRSRGLAVLIFNPCSRGEAIQANVSATPSRTTCAVVSRFFRTFGEPSSWAWIALSIATTSFSLERGISAITFRPQCTTQRCHFVAGNTSATSAIKTGRHLSVELFLPKMPMATAPASGGRGPHRPGNRLDAIRLTLAQVFQSLEKRKQPFSMPWKRTVPARERRNRSGFQNVTMTGLAVGYSLSDLCVPSRVHGCTRVSCAPSAAAESKSAPAAMPRI